MGEYTLWVNSKSGRQKNLLWFIVCFKQVCIADERLGLAIKKYLSNFIMFFEVTALKVYGHEFYLFPVKRNLTGVFC